MNLLELSQREDFKKRVIEMDGWILSATEKLSDIPWAGKRNWEDLKYEFRVLLMSKEYIPTILDVAG